jgi:hypothetical protein
MFLDAARGLYHLSFYNIRVNTMHDLHSLHDLPPEVMSTYFHEYFHFLQDLTTAFGLNAAWNTHDRVRRLLHQAQNSESPINVPFKDIDGISEVESNHKLLIAILSDKKPSSTVAIQFENLKIDSITLTTRDEAEKIMPGGIIRFVQIALKNDDNISAHFWFGAIAVNSCHVDPGFLHVDPPPLSAIRVRA